eukprot:Skav212982  [mRNA]  locus=scaffold423:97643:121234:- [translate_table: standard]
MPFNTHARIPGSVLMVVEHFTTDDVPRHNRRTVKPMVDTASTNLALRVACAGISKTTAPEASQVRPMWMKPLELKVTLCSDHPKEPPTMEPITVTLLDSQTILGVKILGIDWAVLGTMKETAYQEETPEDRARELQAEREQRRQEQLDYMKSLITMEEEKAEAGYLPEDREVLQLREDIGCRWKVDLFDYQDALGEAFNGEQLIGSTVIDLEDSPASELRKPPAMEIEVRREYEGVTMGFPKLQATDVHYGSTGSSVADGAMKLYQANSLSADEFIGAVSIDLRRYVERDCIYIEKADLQFSASTGGDEAGEGQEAPAEAEDENVGSVQLLGLLQEHRQPPKPVPQSEGTDVFRMSSGCLPWCLLLRFEMWFMTQSEANQKRAGKGREDPNDYPQLVTPAEGRGWGDVLGGFSISLPDLGLMKKVIPIVLFTLHLGQSQASESHVHVRLPQFSVCEFVYSQWSQSKTASTSGTIYVEL